MIKLRSDCLVFETAAGENIPCSAESVSVELLGNAAAVIDPEIVRNAAAAVLHYFRVEQGRESVSVGEFMVALKTALSAVGLHVGEDAAAAAITQTDSAPLEAPASAPELTPEFASELTAAIRAVAESAPIAPAASRIAETDLRVLARESGTTFELSFFPRLREVMGEQLNLSPSVLRFTGLRSCVKQLTGARRWGLRCETLSDQIVTYLRECLTQRPAAPSCALVVQ